VNGNVLVTGGTGFVGGHLARALVENGARVRCLVRPTSPRHNLDGLDVEVTVGDLEDLAALRRIVRGCDVVYHCAADYRLYVPDPERMYAANVQGTENLMRAAADAKVRRIVYTSTVGTLGRATKERAADETTPVALDEMSGHYKRSKFLAERAVERWAADGLPVVIVNPSAPVGERDVKPTATGQMIVDFLAGRMPAYVDSGLNLIDVRDVARGHLLAAERGRSGEKYILGHANMTLEEIFRLLAELTGRPAPRWRVPHWIPLVVAGADTARARLLAKTPRVALDAVRLSRYKMFFDAGKAVRELGLPQSSVREALTRAVQWFSSHGYAGAVAR
jgi:dihydroflavonol-4-reductase